MRVSMLAPGMLPSSIVPTCRLVEAGISVIVASMPSAAKIWKGCIVGSALYNSIRSKFPGAKDLKIHSMPSDLKVAKAKAS
jgi:hypothetical protein